MEYYDPRRERLSVYVEPGMSRQVDWSDGKFRRGGILPYTVIDGVRLYCFALDSSSADLTDFGGRRDRRDKDILETALREFYEESLGVFGNIRYSDLLNLEAIYTRVDEDRYTMMLLLPVNVTDLIEPGEEFSRRAAEHIDHENRALVWLTQGQVLRVLDLDQKIINREVLFIIYPPVRILLENYLKHWQKLSSKRIRCPAT
jgi:hypothetical protein